MAYQGIHQLDLARWLCGVDYPSGVYCAGGRFHTQGDAETPDTQSAVFEFPNLLMTYEQTLYTPYMLESDDGIRNATSQRHGGSHRVQRPGCQDAGEARADAVHLLSGGAEA